ncbi:EI24 domain-containing protein [Ichthyenterobacterium sp. W332]|uniref:EI24 domain-containing protein n=1 Tax=Microcosmobacter mediterraneus TaxID=3075607 RepID=A0ABU2YKY6_9FLAO|nr:EI24 domain-containing protein [Ichthyenterobacterium sp. W332]MDT0557905.1 EI24 domain-containing protein [Ichthyenterobacterium sp. W332]
MLKNTIKGLEGYAGAYGLITKLKLWKYFGVPILISFVIAALIAVAAYGWSDNLGAYMAKIWVWDFGKDTFTSIVNFVAGIIILALGLILYKHIIMALSAPFMSPVSEKIEAYLTGNTYSPRKGTFNSQLMRGIRINFRNLGMELLLTLPILLLKFVPVVNIFSTFLLFLVQAYYAGFGNMDYTLERHYNYQNSLQFVRQRRGLAIGNGIGFMLLLLIPVVGVILVLPLSVTAASKVTVDALQAEKSTDVV